MNAKQIAQTARNEARKNGTETPRAIHTDVEAAMYEEATGELTIVADSGTAFTYKGVKAGEGIRHCNCGCGAQVVKRAIYRPGHDARHISQLAAQILEAIETGTHHAQLGKIIRLAIEDLSSTKLRQKLVARIGKVDLKWAMKAQEITDALDADDEEGDE